MIILKCCIIGIMSNQEIKMKLWHEHMINILTKSSSWTR